MLEMHSSRFLRCVTQVYGQNYCLFKSLEQCKYGSVGLCVREQGASSYPGFLFYTLLEKLQS